MGKAILLTIITAFFLSSTFYSVFAGSYGNDETPTCELYVDQQISNPAVQNTIEYIDNTTPQTVMYSPNQAVIAKIRVKNASNRVIPDVRVVNEIPKCFSYVAGPGALSANGRVLTISVGDMASQEEKILYVTYKAGSSDCMPMEPIYCQVNRITAYGDYCQSRDDAQLCVEQKVLGQTKGGQPITVTHTPQTGPRENLLVILTISLLAIFGYSLKRKAL